MTSGVAEYWVFVGIVGIVVHLTTQSFARAVVYIVFLASIANMMHEAWKVDFEVNVGWGPFMLVLGAIVAIPAACLAGAPVLFVRRLKRLRPPNA